MTFLSVRRMLCACVVAAAAVVALAAPGTASAASDLTHQCGGSNIKGLGSTFQAPAENVWTGNFNTSTNVLACNGEQVEKGKPVVKYEQGEASQRGSGNCLKAFGAGATPKYTEYPYCGTDEAPTVAKIEEMEKAGKEGGKSGEKEIETIPTAQGAVAVLIHLPEGCVAESTIPSGTKKIKLGRLALDNATVEKIFRGVIRDWKEVEAAQAGNLTKITCTGGAAEEETPISVVVRLDKSGTTHIFKSYLAQVFTGEWEAEEFNEPEGAGKGKPCGEVKPAKEKVTWKKVQEGCENQRWPEAAKVVRPATTGNPAVIEEVKTKASSISYADLAVTRENTNFSKKGVGGEIKKGTETKVGEQNHKFWAEVQNSATPGTYADPSSLGDTEKVANSNCAATIYASEPGEKFPPKNTRETWFAVKAELVQKKYNICGLTYELALRTYKPFMQPKSPAEEEADQKLAQTTRDFLLYAISAKVGGGGALLKNHDYEKVSGTVAKEAETGIKEIGFATP